MEAVMNGGAPAPEENEPVVAPDGAEPEAVKPVAEEPAAKPEVKSDDEPKGVAKRLKELTEARRAAEAREERLAKLLEETLRGRAAPEKPKVEQPKSLKDFNYDEKAYTDHLYAEARKLAEESAKEAGAKFRAEQEAIQRRAKFDERVAAFAQSVEDYSEVVNESTPVSEGMADAIMDSEEAGALMYYLGNNPDVARKLYYLSPAKAGREIQKIEDRLVAERKKAAEKPVSKAPPPAPKIEAKDASMAPIKSTDPEAQKLPGDEWRKLREKELAARKRK